MLLHPPHLAATSWFHRLSDVTALWNTNAFFAYVLTVKLFKLKWEARRLISVVIATVGAALVVYGSSSASAVEDLHTAVPEKKLALFGDLLTLVASVIYGVYQVLYKMYAAFPNQPDHFDPIPVDVAYEPIVDPMDDIAEIPIADKPDMVYPPPFGLYANTLTTAIGVCTFVLLWIPIPILHYFGLETFRLPTDIKTVTVIAGIALSGVAFNAGLMVRFCRFSLLRSTLNVRLWFRFCWVCGDPLLRLSETCSQSFSSSSPILSLAMPSRASRHGVFLVRVLLLLPSAFWHTTCYGGDRGCGSCLRAQEQCSRNLFSE